MAKLQVERVGGFAAFGSVRSHIRSHGEIELAKLSAEDQKTLEGLFKTRSKAKSSVARDAFRYRISRITSQGVETIEAPEDVVPAAVSQCVKDELI